MLPKTRAWNLRSQLSGELALMLPKTRTWNLLSLRSGGTTLPAVTCVESPGSSHPEGFSIASYQTIRRPLHSAHHATLLKRPRARDACLHPATHTLTHTHLSSSSPSPSSPSSSPSSRCSSPPSPCPLLGAATHLS